MKKLIGKLQVCFYQLKFDVFGSFLQTKTLISSVTGQFLRDVRHQSWFSHARKTFFSSTKATVPNSRMSLSFTRVPIYYSVSPLDTIYLRRNAQIVRLIIYSIIICPFVKQNRVERQHNSARDVVKLFR